MTANSESGLPKFSKENNKLNTNLKSEDQFIPTLKLLERTINSIRDGITVTDLEGYLLFVNDAVVEMYGYSKDELIGKHVSILDSNKNSPGIQQIINRETRDGGWNGRLYNKRKNGENFLISLSTSTINNDEDEPVALVGAAVDLTAQIEKDEVLRSVEDKFRTLFMELKETVYESTPDGRLRDINPSGVELFGYSSKKELLQANISNDLYVNPSDRELFKQKLEKDGFVRNYEIKIRRKDGTELTVLETASLVRDKNGNIDCYRGILRDITESKRNEILFREYLEQLSKMNEQLKASEEKLKRTNSEKDKFFSIIAHDLKSPFNSLLGLTEFLATDLEDFSDDEIKNFAQEINLSARNVFKLLDNLLQWSQIQTGRLKHRPEDFDLSKLTKEILLLLSKNAEKKNVRLESNIPLQIRVYADYNMVNSVIQNLISNAIKFTDSGDVITVTAEKHIENVLISVADSGIGMTPDIKRDIFRIDCHHSTPGTRNESGTGLGLILCKELVEKNGGEIWVESEKGIGTTFFFTLPSSQNK